MQLRKLVLAGGLVGLATSAFADAGVRPVWTDFQPAVSTQYRPPDGGRRYPPPDTHQLISPKDRQRAERAETELNKKAAQPGPTRGSSSPVLRSKSNLTDPLALPPGPSAIPSSPTSPLQ